MVKILPKITVKHIFSLTNFYFDMNVKFSIRNKHVSKL